MSYTAFCDLREPEPGGAHVQLRVVSAAARREVQAEPHRLRLQELGEVEGYGGEEARHDVAHRALGVADQSAQRSGS